jgi:hypothetical protein
MSLTLRRRGAIANRRSLAPTTNLCTNGGFETNITGWTANGTNTFAVSAEQALFGSKSGKITLGDSFRSIFFVPTLTAVPHVCSAYVWIPSASAISFGIQLEVRDFAGGTGDGLGGTVTNLRDQWARISVPITPVGGDLTGVLYVNFSGGSVGAIFYIDGVQIEAHPFSTPYVETDGGTASRV